MKKNGLIFIATSLGIFTIIYFIAVFSVADSFSVDYDKELFNLTIAAIEDEAAIYGEATTDLFKESDTVYVTVEELALKNVIMSNSYGIVKDPRDDTKTLNELKVRIVKNKNDVEAKVLGI